MSKKSKTATLRSTIDLMRKGLSDNEKGATAIEYALIACGIGVAIAAAVTKLGTATAALYTQLANLFS